MAGPVALLIASLSVFFIHLSCARSASELQGSQEVKGDGAARAGTTTVVLYDDFSSGHINNATWRLSSTGLGGGGHQFNMYTPEPVNSFVRNGILYIKPTLTVDHFGDDYLENGVFDAAALWGACVSTDPGERGCHLSGRGKIPPVMSAMLTSRVAFKYGRVTVVARLPKGDWIHPAIWLLPQESLYGSWPRSGDMNIMESRGNQNYRQHAAPGLSMGGNYSFAGFRYGVRWDAANQRLESGEYRPHGSTLSDTFHTYWMYWTASHIRMGIDNMTTLAWETPAEGYFKYGGFHGDNIWANASHDAPFDRPFYLVMNVAVGGKWFRQDYDNAGYAQPWQDADTKEDQFVDFWQARNLWHQTWHGNNAAMRVKSVKIEQYH